jgi:hypothetical protein
MSADLGGHRLRAGTGARCTNACGYHEADADGARRAGDLV